MASRQATAVLGHIRKLVAVQSAKQLSDRELLSRFVDAHDEAAFAALMHRHGPMVLSACQRILHRTADAEDACQATFLVLARKAASERWQESIANWLYGVARRLALKARSAAARRQVIEHGRPPRPPTDPLADITARELQTVLDEELIRLPEKYRAPILLCCLEGHARDEAAQQLGWPLPTLKSRLEQAREMLRRRLIRRGVTLSAALAGLILAQPASAGSFPTALAKGTCKAAMALFAGHKAAATLLPPGVAVLVDSATRAALITKTKIATLLLLAATIAAVSGGLLIPQPGGTGTLAGQQVRNPDPRPGNQDDLVTVSGRVLDPDGKLFEGAELTVCRWNPNRGFLNPAKPKVQAKSGPDGRFSFAISKSTIGDHSADSGNAYNRAWLQVVAAADGYAPTWESIRGSEAKELTLSLAKDDFPIDGRVLDLQGRPVAGAAVRIIHFRTLQMSELYQYVWRGLPENVTTDKDGRFRLTGLGRSRMILLRVSGPTIEQIHQYVPTIPVLYGNNAKSASVEIIAGPTKPITGVIRAKDTGKPLAGAVVDGGAVVNGSGVRTMTDENGRYRLIGLPKANKYGLVIHPIESQSYLPKDIEMADTEGLKPIIKNIDLERGVTLQLRFMDQETGKPVFGQLEYYACFDNPRYEATRKDLGNHHRFWPNKDGVYNFVVVPGPGIIGFWAGLDGEKLSYLTVKLKPEDVKAHPGAEKRPIFFGGLVGVESFNAYRLIDAQPSEKPLTLDIPIYPKH